MAKIRFVLNKSNIRRDGTCPVCLRITQNGRLKYIDLGLSATVEQWNVETERFKKDRRVVANYENYITKNYDGVELYDHVRTRYKRINMNMKKLGKELGIRLPLTTYVLCIALCKKVHCLVHNCALPDAKMCIALCKTTSIHSLTIATLKNSR